MMIKIRSIDSKTYTMQQIRIMEKSMFWAVL